MYQTMLATKLPYIGRFLNWSAKVLESSTTPEQTGVVTISGSIHRLPLRPIYIMRQRNFVELSYA
jgi:hypothetical protein